MVIDYLPWMYVYEFIMTGAMPKEKFSYLTLLSPFDFYTWICTYGIMILVFIALHTMQKFGSHSFKHANPDGHIFQGNDEV